MKFQTKIAMFVNLKGGVTDAYSLALIFDDLLNKGPDLIGVSYAGLICGVILSLFSTAGDVYYKWAQNVMYVDLAQCNELLELSQLTLRQ